MNIILETNRGTGAGGANTITSGIPFEEQTDLSNYHTILEVNQHSNTIQFLNSELRFIYTKQKNFEKYMGDKIIYTIKALHGSKRPDEAYINEEKKIIFIIEKKNQNTSGSKCECIQTAVNKRRNLKRRIPDYHVVYIYCLSSWFKTNCEAEIEDLQEDSIPVFWGNEDTYKTDIIKFMINY